MVGHLGALLRRGVGLHVLLGNAALLDVVVLDLVARDGGQAHLGAGLLGLLGRHVGEVGHADLLLGLLALGDDDVDGGALRHLARSARVLVHDLALLDAAGVALLGLAHLEVPVLRDGRLGVVRRHAGEVGHRVGLGGTAQDVDQREDDGHRGNDAAHRADDDVALALAVALLLLLGSLLGGALRSVLPGARNARHGGGVAGGHTLAGLELGGGGDGRSGAGQNGGGAVDLRHASCEVVAQHVVELQGGLEAVGGVLLHALEDDGLKRGVHGGVELRGRLGLLVDLLQGDGDGVVALKGHLARGGLVHDDAQGVDVGGGAKLLALRLLGRDVVGGAQDGVVLREVAVLGASDAEVHHLDVAIGLHHDVLRLDVAVDDVVTVGHGERLGNLGANLGNLLAVEGAVLLDAALEVGAAQVLHDDVVRVAVLAPVIDRDDVRALQRCRGLGLLLEARRKRGVVGVLRQHRLDGHGAAQDLVLSAVDRGHAAGANPVLNLVASA